MSETEAMELVRRRRRSRAEAEELVGEFESSGQTREAFCAGHGLSVASLDRYRRLVAEATHRTGRRAGRLVAVEVMSEVSTSNRRGGLWVELAKGRRIEVGSGFDAATLWRLLQVLEEA
jgi:predicted RNase H-like nuclease (RuvC/YqgF family)